MDADRLKLYWFTLVFITMSTITEIEKLLEMGAKMWLKDKELKQFELDEQSRMRDEREKDLKDRQEKKENLSYKWKNNCTVIALEKNDNINLKWKPEKNSSPHLSVKEK